MKTLFIPVLSGTAREGSLTKRIAQEVFSRAKLFGFESEFIDVSLAHLSKTEEQTAFIDTWKMTMEKADGLIVVSPEYNHGYPGELKLFLDEAYKEYHKKPLALFGVSDGGLGGARMVEQLRLVSIELHMVPIRNSVYFSNANNLFNNDGTLNDSIKEYDARITKVFDELKWYGNALKVARENDKGEQ